MWLWTIMIIREAAGNLQFLSYKRPLKVSGPGSPAYLSLGRWCGINTMSPRRVRMMGPHRWSELIPPVATRLMCVSWPEQNRNRIRVLNNCVDLSWRASWYVIVILLSLIIYQFENHLDFCTLVCSKATSSHALGHRST